MSKASKPSSPVLPTATRGWLLLASATALLPLLLQLPGSLAALLGGVGLVIMLGAWRKPLPTALRVLLTFAMLAAVFWLMGLRMGRDTGCALLAAMLAIKPAETSTLRDGRSLVGFALFAPFAAFLLDQGPITMGLSLLAALLALVCLQQLADVEAGLPAQRWTPRQLSTSAKLVLLGLPLMLIAFWFFPRMASPLWGVPDRAVSRPGLSDRMTPGEWIDILADDSPALRVQFFGTPPKMQDMYWRGPVLTDFDGRNWTPSPWLRSLPAAPTTPSTQRWDYEVEIEPTDRRQLIALDLPLAAPDSTQLSMDYGLFVRRPLTSVSRWRLQSSPPAQFEPELKRTLRDVALRLPDGLNPRTTALAKQWREEVGGDDAALVQRALQWIRAEFGYTLDMPPAGRDAVDEFLFDRKLGYCQDFSSAFAVLMRNAGIPTRVVTGYVGGYKNPFGDYWVVRRLDAHAWNEVWLPQRGWVRVDPTAAVAPERIYDTLEDRLGDQGSGLLSGAAQIMDFGDWLRRGWNNWVLGFNADRQRQLLSPFGIDDIDGRDLGLLFVLLSGLTVAGMAAWLMRGRRDQDPLLRAWHRLSRRYARLGLTREPHETALDWAQRVSQAHPASGPALMSLSQRFANSRYAGGTGDTSLIRDLRRHRP